LERQRSRRKRGKEGAALVNRYEGRERTNKEI
jgi:hypothetical protein